MQFLEKGLYITTDKAYILYLKNEFKQDLKINDEEKEKQFLQWFIKEYQHILYNFAPKTANASWNKANFMKEANFNIPNDFNLLVVKGQLP